MPLLSFLGKIPWKNILASAPEIVEAMNKLPLFHSGDDIQARLTAQAAVIEKLAVQNAQLAKTVETLSARIIVIFLLSLAAFFLAFYAFFRGPC